MLQQQQLVRDPDAALVVIFKSIAVENPAKTLANGRPMYDDVEVVEIRFPGRRDYSVFPATAFSDWVQDQFSGSMTKRTYAERFSHQYRQFKEHATQTKQGTPLAFAPFLTEGKRAELRALNVYTVEALSLIEGADLKNLGLEGRDLKNKATEYLAEAQKSAPGMQLQAELEALRARNEALEEDARAMAAKLAAEGSGDEMLDAMTDAQLKDWIHAQTGNRPVGNPVRKTLLRIAMEVRSNRAA
jgi:hypothetical protein